MFENSGQGLQGVAFFQSNPIDPSTLMWVLFGLVFFVSLLIYATYRYKQFKKMAVFAAEMRQLGLNPDEEDALTSLVKKHALAEPVDVLMSLKTFDDLAEREIERILGSAGSTPSKDKFINLVYDIRRKTYYPELRNDSEEPGDTPKSMGDLAAASTVENTLADADTSSKSKNSKSPIKLSNPVGASS